MVLQTSESSEFIDSRSESADANDCLLDERELSETKRSVTNQSVLSRILISFGFMKGIVEDSCSRGEITDKIEHGKYDILKPCDQLHDSTLKESLITKEGKAQRKPMWVFFYLVICCITPFEFLL